nr:hypothetical protein B0A51_03188 [Rachicladosporium sp. CCFEE 5018]
MTDPTLFIQGVRAHQLLEMTDDSLLSPAYKRRPPTFYKIGRIFKVLWAEPAGEASSLITTLHHPEDSILGRHGERIFAKVRRFVVVREGAGYCSAVPINTYGGRGVEKAGVTKSEHAIIYTGKTIPTPRLAEMSKRGEAGMLPQPIRVDPDKPEDRLDPMSRIDFGKVHTVVHNIKAQSFGQVNRQSMDSLVHQFQEVWQHQSPTSRGTTGSTAAVSAQGAEESARVALHKLKARGYTQQEARALLLQFASERYSNRNTSGTISTTDGGKQTPQGGENESSEEAEPGDDEEEDDEEEDLYGPG